MITNRFGAKDERLVETFWTTALASNGNYDSYGSRNSVDWAP